MIGGLQSEKSETYPTLERVAESQTPDEAEDIAAQEGPSHTPPPQTTPYQAHPYSTNPYPGWLPPQGYYPGPPGYPYPYAGGPYPHFPPPPVANKGIVSPTEAILSTVVVVLLMLVLLVLVLLSVENFQGLMVILAAALIIFSAMLIWPKYRGWLAKGDPLPLEYKNRALEVIAIAVWITNGIGVSLFFWDPYEFELFLFALQSGSIILIGSFNVVAERIIYRKGVSNTDKNYANRQFYLTVAFFMLLVILPLAIIDSALAFARGAFEIFLMVCFTWTLVIVLLIAYYTVRTGNLTHLQQFSPFGKAILYASYLGILYGFFILPVTLFLAGYGN